MKQNGITASFLATTTAATAVLIAVSCSVFAQAPGVEIVRDKGEQHKMLVEKANKLREAGKLLSLEDVATQLKRKTCEVQLPKPETKKLTDREIWQRSKDAHLRVGWHYRCKKCDKWHQNLAGGYFINSDGVAATCYHVLDKTTETYRDGYLVAANGEGDLFVVTEVLAADKVTDVAIIRLETKGDVVALPLNTNTYPSDPAWCYSDPLGRSGYFSKGIINRFYYSKQKGTDGVARIELSTDWAPGSSGAAILDQSGNAIGHVSTISAAGTRRRSSTKSGKSRTSTGSTAPVIVFHSASRAADVLSLVK